MPNIFEIKTAIINRDPLGIALLIIVFFISLFWKVPNLRHLRYRIRIVMAAMLFGAVLSVNATYLQIAVLLALIAAYASVAWAASKNAIWPSSVKLQKIEGWLKTAQYRKLEKIVDSMPFYFLDAKEKLEWLKSKASYKFESGNFREAYEINNSINAVYLFAEEKEFVEMNKVSCLLMLGDNRRARLLFDSVNNEQTDKNLLKKLYLKAWILESEGNLKSATQALFDAVSSFSGNPDATIAAIYNNLGRMRKAEHNFTDTMHYYKKAAEIARELNKKELIHIAYPNLIDMYLLQDRYQEADENLTAYSNLIDRTNIDDLIKFRNYQLEYARQKKDFSLFAGFFEEGRKEILPKATKKEQLILEITELRILSNANTLSIEHLVSVEKNLVEYVSFEFTERYKVLKEIFIVLNGLAATVDQLGQFKSLWQKIILQFKSIEQEKQIDKYLLNLPDYCVGERCYWLKEKVFLRKAIPGMYDASAIFREMEELKAILLYQDNFIPAIETCLDIADEAMSQNMTEKIWTYTQEAIDALGKIESHPSVVTFNLRIAMYAFRVGEEDIARDYFCRFIRSKTSPLHFADWLQRYYNFLNSVLPSQLKT